MLDVLRVIRQFAYLISSHRSDLSELLQRCASHGIVLEDNDLQIAVRIAETYVKHNLKYREATSSEPRNIDLELQDAPIDQRSRVQSSSEKRRSDAVWFNDDAKTHPNATTIKI